MPDSVHNGILGGSDVASSSRHTDSSRQPLDRKPSAWRRALGGRKSTAGSSRNHSTDAPGEVAAHDLEATDHSTPASEQATPRIYDTAERPQLDVMESYLAAGHRRPGPPPRSPSAGVTATRSDMTKLAELHKRQAAAASSHAPQPPRKQPTARSSLHLPGLPGLSSMPHRPLLPTAIFPGQGSGKASEYYIDQPIWARQPWKLAYYAYFGLSIGFVFLPWYALVSLFPSKRKRRSWSWKRSTMIQLYRHGARLTFRTHTSLSRDLSKEVPHSETVRCKFVWVPALRDDEIRGEVLRAMRIQGLKPQKTCGFWYGERDGGAGNEGGVGQKAAPGEKVVYHLHGGAYWIGTAHEKDVTSAVNVEVLRALDELAKSTGSAGAKICRRSFSLDYRLCVPGAPEIGSYPAPLLDALAGYKYLVDELGFEPENIYLAGDSAGGNLALALCRYLRDQGKDGLPGARWMGMAGGMLLASPWADTSRSHSGPLQDPNILSTVWLNRKSDIIGPWPAFRNTACSALLGKLAAREAYQNPYLSSISLQLPAENGGAAPHYGFEGFPKKVYITTGTAEISYDQHLTLAHRLAAGTRRGKPIYVGDKCAQGEDPFELAARLSYPRPRENTMRLWPSAVGTPSGLPLEPSARWAPRGKSKQQQQEQQQGRQGSEGASPSRVAPIDRVDAAAGYNSAPTGVPKLRMPDETGQSEEKGPVITVSVPTPVSPAEANGGGAGADLLASTTDSADPLKMGGSTSSDKALFSSPEPGTPGYFAPGQPFGEPEERIVILDETRDAVHDFLLFNFFEPERGRAWRRIAAWIASEVIPDDHHQGEGEEDKEEAKTTADVESKLGLGSVA